MFEIQYLPGWYHSWWLFHGYAASLGPQVHMIQQLPGWYHSWWLFHGYATSLGPQVNMIQQLPGWYHCWWLFHWYAATLCLRYIWLNNYLDDIIAGSCSMDMQHFQARRYIWFNTYLDDIINRWHKLCRGNV